MVVDIVLMVMYFPVWWYGAGTIKIIRVLSWQAQDIVRSLNLKILAQYLFVPMYGLTDIWSRLISFPVRLVHFSLLTLQATAYIILLLALLAVWLLAPVFVVYNIVYQFGIIDTNIYLWL